MIISFEKQQDNFELYNYIKYKVVTKTNPELAEVRHS